MKLEKKSNKCDLIAETKIERFFAQQPIQFSIVFFFAILELVKIAKQYIGRFPREQSLLTCDLLLFGITMKRKERKKKEERERKNETKKQRKNESK